MLPPVISSIPSFSEDHPVAPYFLFLVSPSLISFPEYFIQYRILNGSSYARCDESSKPSFFLQNHIIAIYQKVTGSIPAGVTEIFH